MPSTDDFVPDFDHFDEQPPVAAAPAPAEPEDAWGFGNSKPKFSSKIKKKKGKKVSVAKQAGLEEGEDSSAYPKSITPSPPTDHGVRIHQAASPPGPAMPVQPAVPISPLVNLDDDTTAVEEVDPSPSPKPSFQAPSQFMRSPKPIAAKPAPMNTPPTRPASLHMPSQRDRNNSLTGHRPSAPVSHQAQQRRESLASTRPRFLDPPPPHMPQPHFFHLPTLGLKLDQKQGSGRPAGSDGYCCRIDSFADVGDDVAAKKARDALLVGSEGGLEVFRILPNKLEVVGRLEGLRGSVIDAKVLPHTETFDDLQVFRPLVAVIIHGPSLNNQGDGSAGTEDRDVTDSVPSHFQTTVDVYSLQTQHYIATLYSSMTVPIEPATFGQAASSPDPVGDLQVDANGRFVTVSSGKSGEVFVFTQGAYSGVEETHFRCIGKFWTSVQKQMPSSRPATANDIVSTGPETKEEPGKPLVSLSQRWLAIVPPFLSSNISIQGVPLLSGINPSPPGITTHAAPPQPIITCEVVGTDVEGAWSRLGRQAAQGLVRYSQRGIEMGWQGWKELTQPSPPGGRPLHDRSSSREELFPPTKAPSDDPNRMNKEPALVSIFDLDTLLQWEEHKPKHFAAPMATFALVDGCNFLSISSNGTKLLTSSRKGEVSTLWDLMQVSHGVPLPDDLQDEDFSTSPCLKQLQRIARNSPSTVLDCAWSRDDDAVAILTAHGTVHLHEVPKRPPSKKRKRASTTGNAAPTAEKADATVSVSAGMSPPSANQGFLGSIKSSWQTVSTQVNSIRATNPATAFGLPTSFAGFREATAAAGTAGSRAVARGLSQGYTAAKGGASDYWHADDNKIRHTKSLQEPFSAKSLRWVRRNNTTSVAIACGGSVHMHPVQHVTRRKGDEIISGLKHERYAHKAFPLPPISSKFDAGGVQNLKTDSCAGQGPHGFWSLRHSSPPAVPVQKMNFQAGKILQAQVNDVETNPPYCPFHVDSRVNIYAFDENVNGSYVGSSAAYSNFQGRGHGMPDEEAWTFGDLLPASAKVNEYVVDELHDAGLGDDDEEYNDEDDEEEGISSQMESKLTIQSARKSRDGGQSIRINTRRRHGKGNSNVGSGRADGEFDLLEDDDGMI